MIRQKLIYLILNLRIRYKTLVKVGHFVNSVNLWNSAICASSSLYKLTNDTNSTVNLRNAAVFAWSFKKRGCGIIYVAVRDYVLIYLIGESIHGISDK